MIAPKERKLMERKVQKKRREYSRAIKKEERGMS